MTFVYKVACLKVSLSFQALVLLCFIRNAWNEISIFYLYCFLEIWCGLAWTLFDLTSDVDFTVNFSSSDVYLVWYFASKSCWVLVPGILLLSIHDLDMIRKSLFGLAKHFPCLAICNSTIVELGRTSRSFLIDDGRLLRSCGDYRKHGKFKLYTLIGKCRCWSGGSLYNEIGRGHELPGLHGLEGHLQGGGDDARERAVGRMPGQAHQQLPRGLLPPRRRDRRCQVHVHPSLRPLPHRSSVRLSALFRHPILLHVMRAAGRVLPPRTYIFKIEKCPFSTMCDPEIRAVLYSWWSNLRWSWTADAAYIVVKQCCCEWGIRMMNL